MSSKAIVMKYFENAMTDIPTAVACFGPGSEFSGPLGAVPVPDGLRAFLGGFQQSFPDSHFEITHYVETGDQAAVEGFWIGTHTAPMQAPDGTTIPATGRKVRAPFATFLTVRDGKIASHRGYWDLAAFMGQLGLGK
jgi:steroid delta-isomerase-like uncharacterized protein